MKRAPSSLRKSGKKFWYDVTKRFVFNEPHHLKLLEQAAGCIDRIEEAREKIQKDGPYIFDRFNQLREHPAMRTERDNRILLVRIIRELGLDLVVNEEYTRPPRQY